MPMPREPGGVAVPALVPCGYTSITTSGTSAAATIPSGSVAVELNATADCYVKLASSVTGASDAHMRCIADYSYVVAIGGATQISAIQVAAAGVLNINGLT